MASPPPSPTDSAALLAGVQAGDGAALEAVFYRYAERLTQLARTRLSARLRTRIDAEDVVMSAYRSFFVAARQGRFEVERGGDLWRLLVEVTLHKLYRQAAHHRAQRRSINREVQPAAMQPPWDLVGREPTPDESLAAAEELEAVLEQLPDPGASALSLCLEGYRQDEIAARLGCSERSVRRWLSEARRAMAARAGGDFVPSAARRPPPHVPEQSRPAAVAIEAPLVWSDYLLQEQVGAGASGKVYRALRRCDNREVAIKFLKKSLTTSRACVERFVREAATVAALQHPGIVAIHGAGTSPAGGVFLVMDYVAGEDLSRAGQGRPLAPAEAAAAIAEAARIVHFVNEQGIVHCDLKPSNLLRDSARRILVTDFGLAMRVESAHLGRVDRSDVESSGVKQRGAQQTSAAAAAAALGGTPAFMAPEQVDARWGPISPRTDVWGLGSVLYFLLSGRPPHCGSSLADVLRCVVSPSPVNFEVPSLQALPALLRAALCRALEKHPNSRFATCLELADTLAAASA